MSVFQSILLGLLQGVTEFLPVSSSGHLILVGKLLKIESMSVGFELVVHLGSLFSVIVVMRKEIVQRFKNFKSKYNLYLLVATLCSGIIIFLFRSFFRSLFDGSFLVLGFMLSAFMLTLSGLFKFKRKSPFNLLDAVVIGTAQGFAAMPGLSRSGTTISTSMLLGNEKTESAKFSFLLSIPIIICSAAAELIGSGLQVGVSFWCLLGGFLSAFVGGFAALKLLLKVLGKAKLHFFALYLVILSAFILLNDFVLHLF